MFIHSAPFCTGYSDDCVQPNALDITIDSVTALDKGLYTPMFSLRKNGDKVFRPSYRMEPVDGILFDLYPGQYSFESDITVEIPEGVVGWVVARSSLTRNGIFIVSGIYDSGFKGRVGGTIHTPIWIHLEKGVRVAQLITAKAESRHLYDGQYQARV